MQHSKSDDLEQFFLFCDDRKRCIVEKNMDSIVYNKKCGVCTRRMSSTGSIDGVRKHNCVKNYEGSSKSMEAMTLTTMLMGWQLKAKVYNTTRKCVP
jgi:hypothetical protein